jgi:uncharacterized membrane protein YedE/YeeE
MRRFVALLIIAGAVGVALAGAVALAAPMSATPENTDVATVEQHRSAVAVQQITMPLPGLRDEAAMVLVGTALIGLGAAVRRAA